MITSLIVAVSKSFGIGYNGDLLWYLPTDMAYFKNTTLGHPIITGRKNYLSIPAKFRPLQNRENIILTNNRNAQFKDAYTVYSIDQALEKASSFDAEEIFVIGGGEIYKQFLEQDLIDKLYITFVDDDPKADTFFPKINLEQDWNLISNIQDIDQKTKIKLRFAIYTKKISKKPVLENLN